MENNVIITADSACDIPAGLAEKYDIRVIPLTVTVGEDSYQDGVDYTCADMQECYKSTGSIPKTSAPSLQTYTDTFRSLAEAGYEIVHIGLGSGISGSFNNARIAAEELGGGIYPVDSKSLSNGIALLAIEAAECRDAGVSAKDIAGSVEALSDRLNVSFVPDTLEFIRKGGRCSGAAAMGANLLRLKPAIEMKDGKLTVYKKYRGGMKSVCLQYIKERLSGEGVYKNRLFLITTSELDAETEEELRTAVLSCGENIRIERAYTGCTIFSHCGPGAMGIMYISE